MTERNVRLSRWLAAAALIGGLAYRIVAAGPLQLEAPRTAVSLTQPGLEKLLLFLQQVARRVPEGASIAILREERGNPVLIPLIVHYLAVGQLPKQRVVSPESQRLAHAAPDYVAVFGETIEEPRLELIDRLPGGALYRRIR